MSEEFSYDVFLSHSSADTAAVGALAARLKRDGLRVWFDEWEIKPGDLIGLKVEEGLEHSRTLVLFMSAHAFASEWVALERHTALFRDPTNARRRFIPLRLDDSEIRGTLKYFSYVDWRRPSEEQYARLLAACRLTVAAPEPIAEPKQEARLVRVIKGDMGLVLSVALTPDGKNVLTGSQDKTVRLWNAETGRNLQTCTGHDRQVNGVATAADAYCLISASSDKTARAWRAQAGGSTIFRRHNNLVWAVAATPHGRIAVSGDAGGTALVWDVVTSSRLAALHGHRDGISAVAITPDGRVAVTGSQDNTARVWAAQSGRCLALLRGHTDYVNGVAVTDDGRVVVTGSSDKTVRVWEVETGRCLATLEGHTDYVSSVAVTADGWLAVSGSGDTTVRVWDLQTGACLDILRGHTDHVTSVALTPDGRRAVSGSWDETVRVWDLPAYETKPVAESPPAERYTNAKVLLVGDTGVGKSGLAIRLTEDRFEATISTDAAWATQLKLPQEASSAEIEREIWLWDFAGQADYRLIHQLFMDETALAVLVFNPQDNNAFEGLGQWDRDLQKAARRKFRKLLVAGRCDRGGLVVSRAGVERFREERGFDGYLETSAYTGQGCAELRAEIIRNIPWDDIPWTSSPRIFKLLKEEIVRLKDEGHALLRMGELKQQLEMRLIQQSLRGLAADGDRAAPPATGQEPPSLWRRLIKLADPPAEPARAQPPAPPAPAPAPETFTLEELRAVVGLLAGPGVVWQLEFGDFVLLMPERVNAYAAAVIRKVRAHTEEIGVIPEADVLAGDLDYQGLTRLPPDEERIVLRAMHQTFVDHGLCLREPTEKGTLLVFPSYFKRERPELEGHPAVLVTYQFNGQLDEIYSTLVVRLHHTSAFEKDQLWHFAADFKTPGGKRAGLKLTRQAEGAGEIAVYFEPGVSDEAKVTFIKYVHEHLKLKAQDVVRLRHYVCPHCHTPVENRKTALERLARGEKDIVCVGCEERVPLWDLIEQKFASEEFQQRVRELEEQARLSIDRESRELILVGHALAIAGEAGQTFRRLDRAEWGIDGEIEFKDDRGAPSGARVYLQLKAGDVYEHTREADGAEVFTVKNLSYLAHRQAQEHPLMLVVRGADGQIRWMDVGAHLSRRGDDPPRFAFEGEPFTALSVVRLRDRLLRRPAP